VKLPPVQPMASIDAEVAKRCFIVCGPPVPPIYAMKDAFCRFGNLIDVYMLPGKNCGYAKYASISSANEAIEVWRCFLSTVFAAYIPSNSYSTCRYF